MSELQSHKRESIPLRLELSLKSAAISFSFCFNTVCSFKRDAFKIPTQDPFEKGETLPPFRKVGLGGFNSLISNPNWYTLGKAEFLTEDFTPKFLIVKKKSTTSVLPVWLNKITRRNPAASMYRRRCNQWLSCCIQIPSCW